MKVVLATKLSVEECTKRLTNAIDPIPSDRQRIHKALNTPSSQEPLPGAGTVTKGFGYSPGTRPVVGTIKDNVFHFEKQVAKRTGTAPNGWVVRTTKCDGRLLEAPYGTLIELEMVRPSRFGFFAATMLTVSALFGFINLMALYTYLTGGVVTSSGEKSGLVILVFLFIFPLLLVLIQHSTGKGAGQYLVKFVKQVCHASMLGALKAGKGYTGKTQHLS